MPKKVSSVTKVNLGITLLGLGIAAYTATGAGTAAQIVAGIMAYLTGVAGNQTAKWLGDSLDAFPKGQRDIFRNHHLRTLITDAASTVVAKVIAENEAADSKTLALAQKHIGPVLDRALDDPTSPLAALHDFQLPDVLTGFVKKKGKVKLLTVEIWKQLLNTLPKKLWPEARTAIAEALHTDFATALWGHVKDDSTKNGEAAAALEILYLSRIFDATERTAKRADTAPITRRIAKLIGSLDRRASSHFRNLFAQNQSLARKFATHLHALGGKVDRLGKQQVADTRATHRKLDAIAAEQKATDPVQRYLTGLREHFSPYDNVGLPVTAREGDEEKDEAITIRDLFVPPHCADHRIRPAELEEAIRKKEILGKPFLPTLQQSHLRTVLLADPGMGKSTVIQWLIATLAARKIPEDAPELHHAIPFPFILRELTPLLPSDGQRWDWDILLSAFLRWNPRGADCMPIAAALAGDDAILQTLLHSERAFFLIDGLDEIGDPQRRQAVRDAIWEAFDRYPDARFLVTSRIVGYELAVVHEESLAGQVVFSGTTDEEGARLSKKFHHARVTGRATLRYLAPFDDMQQSAFAEHWYVPRMGSERKGVQRAGEFIAAVHQHPHTRVIGRVPNLLYLLALLYRHEANLPNGRALVYEAISKAYLETIPAKRKVDAPFTLQQKEAMLAQIGIRMQRLRASQEKAGDGDLLVSRAQLGEWIGPHFGDAAELDRFLDHIAHTSGLLLPRGEGEYGFAHLSFQEFYAACHLQKDFERIADLIMDGGVVPEEDRQLFAQLAAHPAWHEPLLFLVERLRESESFTKRILKWMFPQLDDGDPAKGEKWMPLSAAQLLATISIDPEVALTDIQRELIWKKLWTAHIAGNSGTGIPEWNVAPYLITAANTFQPAVLRAAATLQPEKLILHYCTAIDDLTFLNGFAALQKLGLASTRVTNLAPLSALTKLHNLGLGGTPVRDLSPLSSLPELQFLNLFQTKVSDLGPLSSLNSLKIIQIGHTRVCDLRPLTSLTSLESLSLDGCESLSNLEPLKGSASLISLSLRDCESVSDLGPLAGLTSLETLYLSGCTAVSDEEVAALQASLPKLKIER